jgi:hypothetical protein
MTTTPTITIFVRHSKGCKYAGDEFAKRCDCRKWLRWTATGEPRQRRPANTRSWAEAEQVRRDIEDQLTGRTVVPDTPGVKNMRAAVEVFLADKKVEKARDAGQSVEALETRVFVTNPAVGEIDEILGIWQLNNGVPGHLIGRAIDHQRLDHSSPRCVDLSSN